MHSNLQKERFSAAFVEAIASAAGLTVSEPTPDIESIDFTLGRPDAASARLDLQLKCSAATDADEEAIPFSIPVKNYDELRTENSMVPRILVAVLVPEASDQWLEMNDARMLLRHCAYWMSLEGREAVDNEHNTTVKIPVSQQFTVEAAHELLDVIEAGGRP